MESGDLWILKSMGGSPSPDFPVRIQECGGSACHALKRSHENMKLAKYITI